MDTVKDRRMRFTLSLKELNILTKNDMLFSAVSRALHGAHYIIHIEECLIYATIHFVRLYYVYINHNLPTI